MPSIRELLEPLSANRGKGMKPKHCPPEREPRRARRDKDDRL